MLEEIKEALKEAVESDGIFVTVLFVAFILACTLGLLALFAWIWWPLPIILAAVGVLSSYLVKWANNE